jgi:type I restriction enzyme S subunit
MELETFFEQFELLADAPNGVQKLRQLILQLAVQGKLVPQDPNDEPASVLLERIRGKLFLLSSQEKHKLDELPQNWSWVEFKDVIELQHGHQFRKYDYMPEGIPVIKIGQCKPDGTLDLSNCDYIAKERLEEFRDYQIYQGDILMALTGGTLGKVTVVDKDYGTVVQNYRVGKFIPDENLYTRGFTQLILKSNLFQILVKDKINQNAQPNIGKDKIEKLEIPLPPLAEQKRIIAKVARLMSLCDELEARQEKQHKRILQLGEVATSQLLTPSNPEAFNQHWQGICDNFDLLYSTPKNVSQLRQAILQLAVMGKLVPQDPNDEPASVLVERIKEEKARLVKEGKIRKSEKLSSIKVDELPYELPDSWQWVRFDEILIEITSGWSPMCEKHPKEDEEWGVLKVSAVSWDKFNPDENKALPSNLKPRPEHEVRAGDFLMSRANTSALVGKSVIVENTPERLLLSDKILRVYFSTFADKKFFNIYNNSLAARAYYSKEASGTSDSMRNISRIQILNLPVPVPPFQEQKRIFVKINQFMSLCDELEAKLTQSISDRGKLMEAAVRQVLAA